MKTDKFLQKSNVLLISLDCVRREAIGVYNMAQQAHTPIIDFLARHGIMFTQAVTAAPYTPASHASILTGFYPFHHGIRRMIGQKLLSGVETVVEVMQRAGLITWGVIGADVLKSTYGLNKGFTIYDEQYRNPYRLAKTENWGYFRKADEITDIALTMLKQSNSNWFMFLHYFDAHDKNGIPPSLEEQTKSMRFIDYQLGRIINFLKKTDTLAHTHIIIVADHGDTFDEHDEQNHHQYIFDTTVVVPLLLISPLIRRHQTVQHQVRTIDLAPTILDLLGLPYNSNQFDGESLLSVINTGDKPFQERLAYIETTYLDYDLWDLTKIKYSFCGVRTNCWKFVLDRLSNKCFLYNLIDDPLEQHNVISNHPAISEQLEKTLQSFPYQEESISHMNHIEIEILEQRLKQLGYLT